MNLWRRQCSAVADHRKPYYFLCGLVPIPIHQNDLREGSELDQTKEGHSFNHILASFFFNVNHVLAIVTCQHQQHIRPFLDHNCDPLLMSFLISYYELWFFFCYFILLFFMMSYYELLFILISKKEHLYYVAHVQNILVDPNCEHALT